MFDLAASFELRAVSQQIQKQLPARAGCFFLGCACGRARQDAEYFFFAHDDEVLTIDFDFGARILAEENAIAFFYVERTNLAFFADLAFAGGDDFSLLRLVFRGVGNDDSAAGGVGLFDPTDQDAIMQRGELSSPSCVLLSRVVNGIGLPELLISASLCAPNATPDSKCSRSFGVKSPLRFMIRSYTFLPAAALILACDIKPFGFPCPKRFRFSVWCSRALASAES